MKYIVSIILSHLVAYGSAQYGAEMPYLPSIVSYDPVRGTLTTDADTEIPVHDAEFLKIGKRYIWLISKSGAYSVYLKRLNYGKIEPKEVPYLMVKFSVDGSSITPRVIIPCPKQMVDLHLTLHRDELMQRSADLMGVDFPPELQTFEPAIRRPFFDDLQRIEGKGEPPAAYRLVYLYLNPEYVEHVLPTNLKGREKDVKVEFRVNLADGINPEWTLYSVHVLWRFIGVDGKAVRVLKDYDKHVDLEKLMEKVKNEDGSRNKAKVFVKQLKDQGYKVLALDYHKTVVKEEYLNGIPFEKKDDGTFTVSGDITVVDDAREIIKECFKRQVKVYILCYQDHVTEGDPLVKVGEAVSFPVFPNGTTNETNKNRYKLTFKIVHPTKEEYVSITKNPYLLEGPALVGAALLGDAELKEREGTIYISAHSPSADARRNVRYIENVDYYGKNKIYQLSSIAVEEGLRPSKILLVDDSIVNGMTALPYGFGFLHVPNGRGIDFRTLRPLKKRDKCDTPRLLHQLPEHIGNFICHGCDPMKA